MSDKKLNCKNCKYKYCPFRGSDREISAFFCEDYEPAEEEAFQISSDAACLAAHGNGLQPRQRRKHECFNPWNGDAEELS